MNFEMAKSNSPEDVMQATQKALINAMRDLVKDFKKEMKTPGMTWEQIDYFLIAFGEKKPIVVKQEEEM